MADLLLGRLPDSVEVGGAFYPINTCFRVGIQFEGLLENRQLSDAQRIARALAVYYKKERIPRDIKGAIDGILWFYRGGEEMRKPGPVEKKLPRIYDFEKDQRLIYAAFLDQYAIDLSEIQGLHWWKFRAMFAGLREDHEITRMMGYRAVDLSKIKCKEERARLKRLKALYRLDDAPDAPGMMERAGQLFARP